MINKTILLKSTLACNLQCKYCYEAGRPERKIFSRSYLDVEKIIATIRRFSKLFPESRFIWTLHGGEPLLIGAENFKKIVSCFKEIKEKSGADFKISIQTNGSLINEEWIELINKNIGVFSSKTISVSIDGPQKLNDSTRIYPNSNRSVAKTVSKNIELLKNAGLNVATLTVVGRHNLREVKEVYDFINSLNPSMSKYIPCYNMNEMGMLSNFGISPMEFADFILELFQYWRIDLLSGIKRNLIPLVTIISEIIGIDTNYCEYSGNKCDNFITLFPNGDLVTCDTYVGEQLKHSYLGNISTIDDEGLLKRILTPNEFTDFSEFQKKMLKKCEMCEVRNVCHGGCVGRREEFLKKNPYFYEMYCKSQKKVINCIRDWVKKCQSN